MKKNYIYPTIEKYYKAVEQADNIDNDYKNTKALTEILSLMNTLNPRIRGAINTRKTAIRSWGWDIIAFDKKDIEKANEAKIRLSKTINIISKYYIQSQMFGAMLLKINWNNDLQKSIPIITKKYKPEEIENYDFNRIAIVDESNNKEIIEENDYNYIKILDEENHIGGILRTIAFSELLRFESIKEWRNYNKKLKGIIQATSKSPNQEDLDLAEAGVRNVTSDNYVVTSEDIDFKFHSMTQSSAANSFKEFKETLDKDISIAIIGNANTADLSKNGSRAATQVQQMIAADLMFSDILNLEEVINNQLLEADYLKNYGTIEVPYRFVIPTDLDEDYLNNTNIVTELISAKVPIIREELYKKTGFKQPSEDDVIFEEEV